MPVTTVVPAPVNTTVRSGALLVIVKLGYVPDMLIPVPAVNTTVWSGAVLVMVKFGYVPLVEIPVPAVSTTVWSGALLESVPAVSDKPVPTVSSSTAPVLAVVRPSRRAVVIVRPLVVIAPGAT